MQRVLGFLVLWVIWASVATAQVWSFSQDTGQRIGSVDLLGQGELQATFRCHIGAPNTVTSFVATSPHPGLVTLMVHPRLVPDLTTEVMLAVDGVPYLQTRFERALPEGVPATRLRVDSTLFAALARGGTLSLSHAGGQTILPLGANRQFADLGGYCAQAPSFARRAVPGFTCARATTPTEHAICADVDLTLLDVALNAAMQEAIARLGDARARGGQRAWLPRRDACGASKGCLQQVVAARIAALRNQPAVVVQVPVRPALPAKTPDAPKPALPALQAQEAVPAQPARQATPALTLPPLAPLSAYSRNMKIARGAWEQIRGFDAPDRPDQRDIRDFSAVLLTDGSWIIDGLGIRLRPVTRPSGTGTRAFLEIVDMQEFSPSWASRSEHIKIGGLIPVELFSIDQTLRTALSRNGRKKLREGFGIGVPVAVPYTNRKNEPAYQNRTARITIPRQTRPHGRWLVAEPAAAPTDLRAELDAIIADARAAFRDDPCGVSNLKMLEIERDLDLLRWEADASVPNLRGERDTACAIAQKGTYEVADLERLAVLRMAMCEDVQNGVLSPKLIEVSEDLRTRVPKGNYLNFASIGVFDFEKPERRKLDASQGRARAACITQFLEDALFE